jgi:hypothetical protein
VVVAARLPPNRFRDVLTPRLWAIRVPRLMRGVTRTWLVDGIALSWGVVALSVTPCVCAETPPPVTVGPGMFKASWSEESPGMGQGLALPSNESTEAGPSVRIPAQEIELHAGHLEIEAPTNRLSLSEGVELTVHRYRVTADRLTLQRTPQGIAVEGDGQVAFCPCVSSPFTVGFSNGIVGPPTDLLLKNATFRACGAPVFWLPAYWIRSPNKLGLLTPSFAWRAGDGPWIGTGVHVPLSPKQERNWGTVDLLTGAYLLGGVDLGAAVRTARSTTSVRWDYYRSGFLAIDTSGHNSWDSRHSLTWQVDALRGTRARTGPVTFEAATRSYDRARAEFASFDGQAVYALGVHGDIARATRLAEVGQLGPAARWGIRADFGDFGRVDSALSLLARVSRSDTLTATLLHSSDFGVDLRPGPLTARTVVRERWLFGSGDQSGRDAGLLGVEQRVGMPLVAAFGGSQRRLVHWLEPFLVTTAALRGYASAYNQGTRQPVGTVQLGVTNKIGYPADSAAASLQLRAGSVIERERSSHAIAARLVSSGDWLALGGEMGWDGGSTWLSILRTRFGRMDRISVRSRLEGRGPRQSDQIRWLLDEAWCPWYVGWFSRSGWIAGADLDIMIVQHVAVTMGTAYDLGQNTVVSEHAGAAYRHPCGCLAVSANADWWTGREGWDILVALDLMP